MRIALVHDYLIQDGGAERVLEVFKQVWPKAPIFALLHDPETFGDRFPASDVRTSFLQRIPFARRRYKWLMPLMPAATERYDLRDFDVVLSSTSAFAKGVITRPDTLHICYCHTPTRYLWSDTHSYIDESGIPSPIKRVMPILLTKIRLWDRVAADRVDHFIANSRTVQDRIRKYYQRDSTVIHPPVGTSDFRIAHGEKTYYIAGGRIVSYKRFDVIVQAFNKLGIPLKIFGDGPHMEDLKRIAAPNIEFLGRVPEEKKAELYANAIAYLHPQEEDFGITPVEAMAAGRPVIAYGKGGALETVIDGKTGVFIEEQSWEELANEIIRFEHGRFDPETIRAHALRFDTEQFKGRIREFVEVTYARHKGWGIPAEEPVPAAEQHGQRRVRIIA